MLRNFRSDACGNYGTMAAAPTVAAAATRSECYYSPTQHRYPIYDFQYPTPAAHGNTVYDDIANVDSDCSGLAHRGSTEKYGSNSSNEDGRPYPSPQSVSPIFERRPAAKYELESIADYNANIDLTSCRSDDAISLSTAGRCDRESDTAAAALTTYPWMKKISFSDDGKRKRQSYTRKQTLELEKEFCYSQYLTKKRRGELCHLLQLSEKQIKTWFQNRRMKKKKETADKKAVDNDSSLFMIDTAAAAAAAKSICGIDTAALSTNESTETDYWCSNGGGVVGAAVDGRISAAHSHPAMIKESPPPLPPPQLQSYQHRPSSNAMPAQFIENSSSQFYFNNRCDVNYS